MKFKFFVFLCVIVGKCFSLEAQSLSIYEFGSPVKDYEDNFKNLVRNWQKEHITNIDDYQLKDIYYVETITEKDRYNYYRNYFSSDQPIGSGVSSRKRVDTKEGKFYEFFIKPAYAYTEFYDSRGMSEDIKRILTEDFQSKARIFLSKELNIDTLQLHNYQKHEVQSDTTAFGHKTHSRSINIISLAPISQNYKDIQIEHTKKIPDLSIEDAQHFILEVLLIERLTRQVYFNEVVKLGDRVYAIDFEYERTPYTVFVICSHETKKVVWDSFFNRITIDGV